jgi:hypothetical protein
MQLSSGDIFVLNYGKEKGCAFKSVVVGDTEVVAKPRKGKVIKISRKLTQEAALMALYKATKGNAWTRKSGWGSKQSISNWEGITCNEDGEVTHINLTNNNLCGELPDIFYAFPRLQRVFLDKNELKGKVPRSLAFLPNNCMVRLANNMLSTTTLYVPRERLDIVPSRIKCYPQKEGYADFRLFVDSEADLNPVNGYYENNECRLYHKATEGTGINIYIMGDGYDKAEYAKGGTAEYWLERAADAIFGIKPYSQLKHLFNVYIIYTYSDTRGVSIGNNKIDSRFGFWVKRAKGVKAAPMKKQEIFDTCKETAEASGFKFEEGVVYVQVVGNSTRGGAYVYTQHAKDSDGTKRKMRVAFNPAASPAFDRLVQHEFCGHAYGGLRDEYNRKGGLYKTFKKSKASSPNVDTESDPTKVKWAKFIADPRYASEKLGVYQGSLNCSNLYRATATSIMRSHRRPGQCFNAPSRAGIYTKAMKQAFPGWEFDYEEFVKFDMGDKYYPLEKQNLPQ